MSEMETGGQSEMEAGGQSVDVESALDVLEQQYNGSPPLQPCEGEALDGGPESGAGQLNGEGEIGHMKTDGRSSQRLSGESVHGEEERDKDREDGSVSSGDEEGKSQNGAEETPTALTSSAKPTRLVQLPLARVKNIMKSDPDVGITSQDSIFLVAKATEQFVAYLAKEVSQRTHEEKRKVVQRKDLDVCVKRVDGLLFLEGAID